MSKLNSCIYSLDFGEKIEILQNGILQDGLTITYRNIQRRQIYFKKISPFKSVSYCNFFKFGNKNSGLRQNLEIMLNVVTLCGLI